MTATVFCVRACAALLLTTGAALLSASSASALIIEPPVYSGTTIQKPTYPGAPAFGFGSGKLAFDQEADVLYVSSGGRVYKFDAATNMSENFSASGLPYLSTATSGGQCCGALEVDNSGTATQGRIYTLNEAEHNSAFFPSGQPDSEFKANVEATYGSGGATNLCGGGMAPDGHYWVTNYFSALQELNFNGTSTGKSKSLPFVLDGCDFEIDSQGSFYVSNHWSGPATIYKFNNAGSFQYTVGSGNTSQVAIDPSNDAVFVDDQTKVTMYTEGGSLLATFGNKKEGKINGGATDYEGLSGSQGITVDEDTHHVYISNPKSQGVDIFVPGPPVIGPDVTTSPALPESSDATLKGATNPSGVKTTECVFEWGLTPGYGKEASCAQGDELEGSAEIPVTAAISGLIEGEKYNFRLVVENMNGVRINGANRTFVAQGSPVIKSQFPNRIRGNEVRINAAIDPDFGSTSYYFEFGADTAYGTKVPSTPAALQSSTGVQTVGRTITGLSLSTEYHFRVVATNEAGTIVGPDRVVKTFPPFTEIDDCPNALARQQTGAVLLGHCRAFELVSAANTGGYNVESDLVPGQSPLPGFPQADGRVLYGVHNGGIPETGSPTNKGVDPYVAIRGEGGWTTKYQGVPADGTPSTAPFASTFLAADESLDSLAFAGPEICDPCFPDGSSGIPLRTPDGSLVQGMKGSIAQPLADPAGFVAKPFSADGSHLIFGADKEFEPAGNPASVSIYDRDLETGSTQVVSTLPVTGATMNGVVGQLDVSRDGERIVVAAGVGVPDAAGNQYWHPYLHVGADPKTVDLALGATTGVIYVGMTSDGSKVFFTTNDKLGADTDDSADLYEATVAPGGAFALNRITAPNTNACNPSPNADGNNWNAVGLASPDSCGAVGIAGGGGVAAGSGTIYFLSPEKLDGSGALNDPNLFVASPGSPPEFVATLDPNDPLVRDAVKDSEVRRTDQFQVTANGQYAALSATTALTGFENDGWREVFRYEAGAGDTDCVSCPSSEARPSGHATLATDGLSLTSDGRVFFTTPEAMVLRDSGERRDAYEWTEGESRLISAGTSPFDSGLLSVAADGRDVYFFTRETLVKGDHNGTLMKIYDARENGGFFVVPDPPPCAASDECHGPGTEAATPPGIRSLAGTPAPLAAKSSCKKHFVRKRGKCVKRKKRQNQRHTSRRNG